MSKLNASRRQFLRSASVVSGSVGAAGAPFALNLATLGSAVAQTAPDYKAIVCLFLYGGNDSSHMVLRTDAASFAEYTRMRATGPDPIALLAPGTTPNAGATRASPARLGGVLPIAPKFSVFAAENAANTYAVHPSMPEVVNLFAAGRLGIIANAGPLVVPLSRTDYTSNSKRRPQALGSHNDQQSTWQALGPEGVKIGWGGHLGDLVATSNTNSTFTSISASGNNVFSAGGQVFQYQVGGGGAVQIGGISGTLFNSMTASTTLRSIVTADNTHLFAKEYSTIINRSIDAQAAFQTAFAASAVPNPTQYFQPSSGNNQTNGRDPH